MIVMNLDLVINDLDSTQIEKQIPAVEEAANIVDRLAIKAVKSLVNSPNPFLVAERLNRFGSIIVPHLEQLLRESDNSEVNILASFVLKRDSRTVMMKEVSGIFYKHTRKIHLIHS